MIDDKKGGTGSAENGEGNIILFADILKRLQQKNDALAKQKIRSSVVPETPEDALLLVNNY